MFMKTQPQLVGSELSGASLAPAAVRSLPEQTWCSGGACLLSLLSPESRITKCFQLYYNTPAIRMFIQPYYMPDWPSSCPPSAWMHCTRCAAPVPPLLGCTARGARTSETGHPRVTDRLTLCSVGQATEPTSAVVSVGFRTDVSLCECSLRAV